jgi:peptide/nickel transport system substrate-binding protein
MDRRKFLQMAGVGAASPFFNLEALAQGSTDRVLIVTELTPNSLDTHTVGANRGAYGVVWMTYDRLITFGLKTLPNGVKSYDYSSLKPQLAESWEFAPDNSAVTFKLRRDATFHDGTAVKAQDVKWSFDRFVKAGGFPQRQMEQ